MKVKMASKILATKGGIRKTTAGSLSQKKKMLRKKRSSNFVMLMKEWEKLEKEGAVAVGKRKRVFSSCELIAPLVRTRRRRLNSSVCKTDYIDIDSIINTSSVHDCSSESSPTRRTRRTTLFGNINDISPEILKEISEKFSVDPHEGNKKDELNSETSIVVKEEYVPSLDVPVTKRKPGRPRSKSNSEENEQIIRETCNNKQTASVGMKEELLLSQDVPIQKRKPGRPRFKSISVESEQLDKEKSDSKNTPPLIVEVKEESLVSQDVTTPKRKPGRPRFKSISEEVDQHITEVIDSIVKRSRQDYDNSEVSTSKYFKVSEEEAYSENEVIKIVDDVLTDEKNSGMSVISNPEQLSFKEKTEEHIKQTIEDIVKECQDTERMSEDINWKKINEVIYNVSIGSADIFKEQKGEELMSNISDSATHVLMKRGRRRRKRGFKKFSKPVQNSENPGVEIFPNNKEDIEQSNNDSPKTQQNQLNAEKIKLDSSENKKSPSNATRNISKVDTIKASINDSDKSLQQTLTSKKKFFGSPREELGNITSKPKEIKTRQLSIADYLSISRIGKGCTDNSSTKSKENSDSGKSDCDDKPESNNDVNRGDEKIEVSPDDTIKEESKPRKVDISVLSKPVGITKKVKKHIHHKKESKHRKEIEIDDKPNSPVSTSSKEDLALSVIRDKVIRKKKKKLKLKKLLKNKRIEVVDTKVTKMTKPKLPLKEERHFLKEKLRKGKKKVRVGVSRNRWEVSVVENKVNPVEILCDDEIKSPEPVNVLCNESMKKFYCSLCDQKFDSSYKLYEHQLTPEHKLKSTITVKQSSLSEENDPVKYCKSIGNIINDLEKRTLNVAKVMQQLKQRDSPDHGAEVTPAVVESTSSPVKEPRSNTEENWQSEWPVQQEWPSRSTTPLWEGGAQQTWEVDSFSTGCSSSLGSIMDTVNKLLSDQEMLTVPTTSGGYSWSDLQLAMGASDEEMAMLEQLGEHSLQEEYVYDNSRPAVEWPPPEENPTFTDLDHQDQATSAPSVDTLMDVKKTEPLSDSEDSKVCRTVIGRPRRLLGDYESREMVCPTCNKHFLGLPALQTHVAWSHCAPVGNTSRLMSGLKRRALLSSDEVDRRLVCFVCKEIVSSTAQLEAHIQAQHTKRSEEQEPSKPVLSEAAEKLKSKMSLALGGLVDRALNKLLGTGKPFTEPTTSHSQTSQADLNSGALQLLGRLCAARKRVGSENMKLSSEILQLLGRLRAVNHKEEVSARAYNNALANEMRQILSRGKPIGVSKGALQASVNNSNSASDLKPTNLLDHLAVCSSDVQERPYACPICDLRFLIPSTRNRHIARAHGKYGRRYDEEVEDFHSQDDLETDWKSSLEAGVEANDSGEMLPLCSDCGLSFQSIHEVMQHRIEDHPRRFSAEALQEDNKPTTVFSKHSVVESSSETKQSQELSKNNIKLLPVSDNAIDSTSTMKKKRGRPPKLPESKAGQKRKCPESEKKTSPCRKNNRGPGRRKKQVEETEHEPEDSDVNDDEDSLCEMSHEESIATESTSPETDKSSDKLIDKLSNRNSSEENLAELSKKLDRRKVRMGNMAEEAVRVKAEAALRELNLTRKTKSQSSVAKWGINAVKFTKQTSPGMSSSQVNGSPSKTRFASLVDKKWKMPATSGMELQVPKPDIVGVKPDIYDFRDEDLDVNKKPFQQFKETHLPESEHSESNKLVQSNNCYISGSPKKAPHNNSKLSTDSS